MSSLASLVTKAPLKEGDDGAAVLALQLALSQAGYRIGQDSDFGPRTKMVVQQFQTQHGLRPDGVVGPLTAALLDAPHETLVTTAVPLVKAPVPGQLQVATPHDDTASLLAFYGKPWEDSSLLTHVPCPWTLYYEGKVWPHPIPFNSKAAKGLAGALNAVWEVAGGNDSSLLTHIRNYSGSYEYRPVRGSSRLSCHAFGVAIDFDAEHLPLGHGVPATEMPKEVVDAFKANGAFWGGDYTGRKDPMHFQWAHE